MPTLCACVCREAVEARAHETTPVSATRTMTVNTNDSEKERSTHVATPKDPGPVFDLQLSDREAAKITIIVSRSSTFLHLQLQDCSLRARPRSALSRPAAGSLTEATTRYSTSARARSSLSKALRVLEPYTLAVSLARLAASAEKPRPGRSFANFDPRRFSVLSHLFCPREGSAAVMKTITAELNAEIERLVHLAKPAPKKYSANVSHRDDSKNGQSQVFTLSQAQLSVVNAATTEWVQSVTAIAHLLTQDEQEKLTKWLNQKHASLQSLVVKRRALSFDLLALGLVSLLTLLLGHSAGVLSAA